MTIIKAKKLAVTSRWCNNIYEVASERCRGGGERLSFFLGFQTCFQKADFL